MNIYAYLRVSTDQQDLGLDVQESLINDYARKNSFTITRMFKDENFSGGLHYEYRPSLKQAIDGIKKGDILLVTNRDRLGRGIIITARIEYEVMAKKGARIISIAGEGNDDKDILTRRMIDVFAEHERMRIAQRVKEAMQEKKRNNEWLGTAPIGYKVGNDGIHLEHDEQESKAIAAIKRLRRKGLSMQKIADRLNTRGILNRGKPWNKYAVIRRLYN